MFKEKLAYWSGPAAGLGGMLQLLPSSGWLPNLSESAQLWVGLIGFVLTALGLVGLYLHASASESRGSVMAIDLALVGVLLVSINMVIRLAKGPAETPAIPLLVIGGMLFIIVGLIVTGIITLSRQALGTFSFVPLALGIGYVAVMISFGLVLNDPSLVFVAQIIHALTILGWLLLGVALWQEHREYSAKGSQARV